MRTLLRNRSMPALPPGRAALPPEVPAGAVPDLQASAGEAAALLKALANPDRLLLLCQLVAGERPVTELGSLTGLVQPSLSQQLGVLRGERLVATRRQGKQVVYRIASPAALAVLHTLYGLYCQPAVDASADAAECSASAAKGAQRARKGQA